MEKKVRLCKEYKLDLSNTFKLKYGSMNRINPNVVYVEGKTYIGPTEEFDYENGIKKLMSSFKKNIANKIKKDSSLSKNFVFDYDVAAYRMKQGAKKILLFNFYFKQGKEIIPLKDIKNKVEDLISEPLGNLEFSIPRSNFIASKTKK